MQIDLSDKATSILVQEYVNKICNFETKIDLDWNVHKLIHTFQVIQMAQLLIDQTTPSLPKAIQKHILNAALLHDIGRCYEYKNGKRMNIDHGKIGAALIRKYFPKMTIEADSTCFHNKLPSDKDPKNCKLVLNYVRDADMLANIDYQIKYPHIWLSHLFSCLAEENISYKIDPEILRAVQEHRCSKTKNIKNPTLLNMLLSQLCWYYVLQTKAAFKIAHTQKLFIRFRDIICYNMIPQIIKNRKNQHALVQQIEHIFVDDLFK